MATAYDQGVMPKTPVLRSRPERDDEILSAALEVLRQYGYDKLTVDAVVARAHASKATVYRRWPSKSDLALAAFARALPQRERPDSGDLRSDLSHLLDQLADDLAELADVIAVLLLGRRSHPELARSVDSLWVLPNRRAFEDAVARAVARGEVRPGVDVDLAWHSGPALLFFRSLVLCEPVDRALASRVLDDVVMPLFRRPAVDAP